MRPDVCLPSSSLGPKVVGLTHVIGHMPTPLLLLPKGVRESEQSGGGGDDAGLPPELVGTGRNKSLPR